MSQPSNHNPSLHNSIPQLVKALVEGYKSDTIANHLDSVFLPSRARAIDIIELLRKIIFPGFFDDHRISSLTVEYHLGEQLVRLQADLKEEIRQALRYDHVHNHSHTPEGEAERLDAEAGRLTATFLATLPELRRLLALDAKAAFDGDPAAHSTDETIFCYPGVDAIFIHRMAHELYKLSVPLLPRMMAEYAHNETGIDIHPGATIGESFFIDHGTGVVIGETCIIGNRVKMFHGVTLGAISTKGGQAWKGSKRHPTIEDDVTIYSGAIILGGDTVIGKGCTIGGSVFITKSIPAGYTVTVAPPELKMSAKRKGKLGESDPGEFSI
jgi:serine O-acetyltransferase